VKRPFESARWYALILGLVAALAILAFLQYRSGRQLSDATSEQMRTTLDGAIMDMRSEVESELEQICLNLQANPARRGLGDLQQYAMGFAQWRSTAEYPGLIANVFVWRSGDADSAPVLRLNPTSGEFVASDWPVGMAPLRKRLQEMFPSLPTSKPQVSFAWLIDEHSPALVHATLLNDPSRPGKLPGVSWIVIQLDQQVMAKQIFPDLANRYFSGKDGLIYQVAVLSGNADQRPVYSSDDEFGSHPTIIPDATLNLFDPPLSPLMPQTIHYGPAERDWRIIARHRKGSLEAAVSSIFYRDLAIDFAVLTVLAITIGLIIVLSARARRLAQLQVDFVAGVSHELRTPLTGIVSAAQNIADGVVENKEQMARYGNAILSQARQLSELIEQILTFSATDTGRQRYHLQLSDVAQVIDASLQNTTALAHSAGVTVERVIEQDLPRVNVDRKVFSQCLQNLIANAIKYSGETRWVRVRAYTADGPDGQKQVNIVVEDRGIGIDPADLKQIFEPFYRSATVTAAQIHGSGLGLPLAKAIAEAMGGSLTVESTLGQGSSFTVHLPVHDHSEVPKDPSAKLNSVS
jgi:signal transduction histidine kinase